MKKQILGLSAIVFAVLLSAFTLPGKNADNQTVLEWHKYNTAGTSELAPAVIFDGTESQARSEFGCPNAGSKICARAYDDAGTPLSLYISKP